MKVIPDAGRAREQLAELAGSDIADKLTDDQCVFLNTCISLFVANARRQGFDEGFDEGWRAGIDHASDYAEAFFAPKTKAH